METECIKREDVIEAICNLCRIENDDCSYPRCTIINTVKNINAADVVERKRGDWIRVTEELGESWMCSECMEEFIPHDGMEEFASYAHFCPNCGAQMGDE